MYNSYREALILGKAVEQPAKITVNTVKNYSLGQIKKMCIWGKINELKNVSSNYFTPENIIILNDLMKEKIIEIENWKYEDQNQLDDVIQELNDRIEGISKCLEFVKLFSIVEN
jgi:hypothetical protein